MVHPCFELNQVDNADILIVHHLEQLVGRTVRRVAVLFLQLLRKQVRQHGGIIVLTLVTLWEAIPCNHVDQEVGGVLILWSLVVQRAAGEVVNHLLSVAVVDCLATDAQQDDLVEGIKDFFTGLVEHGGHCHQVLCDLVEHLDDEQRVARIEA